ncbi:hypothetical protein Ami103574_04470 [Aminipila butyrica]|uniref:Uncharacterized protein n=1 Tax=Aminipila butyrica TaxID=433296 RepID=A0A858BSR4_9FIRM|nr:hypothetical protein [Aminipila butyrica]QIB68617.1 hypothetical protein Ami103574_04470 [Aminipila butyrica]
MAGALELAAHIGIPVTEFWEITPFELSIVAKGYAKRKAEEQKESIAQAYLISRWVWQKKINIKKIFASDEKKKPMTDDQMLERVKALNTVFGGIVEEK